MPDRLAPSGVARDVLRDRSRQLWLELQQDLVQLDRAPKLHAVESRRAELERYVTDLEAQLERHESAAVITLVGSTGAGKSTLLNALAGQEIARAGTTRPTTSRPVIYKPRSVDVQALIADLGPVEVHEFEPGAGPSSLAQAVLVDAPDTNSVATEHRQVVEALAERSDALVVVAHRQSVAELAQVSFVDLFAGRRDLCFVLGRADELSSEARQDLEGQLAELARTRWQAPAAPIVVTSALAAGRGQPDAGFEELTRYLATLVEGERLGSVRRDNALGTAARIAGLFQATLDELQEDEGGGLAGLMASVHGAIGRFRELVEAELAERLELRGKDIELLLWNETARRWQGPGGWALRAGGLAGLGMGAGAALARKNPLVAAGAAAGGLALDRAQSSLRERRIERASGLVPTAHELESWYREAFVAPRIQAQGLTGDPAAFDLPGAEALGAEATLAVEAAWARLVERQLPDAATRGARLVTRLMVDLPVYILCAWLVLKALMGVLPVSLTGALLPPERLPEPLVMDDLLSAAIVLFAWLFIGRSLVRLRLGRLARGLAQSVLEEARAGLEEPHGIESRTTESFDHELQTRQAALGRLAELDELWRGRLHAPSERP